MGQEKSCGYLLFRENHESSKYPPFIVTKQSLPGRHALTGRNNSIKSGNQIFGCDFIITVSFTGTHRHPGRKKLFDIKSVLLIKIGKQFVIWVFGYIVFPGEERPHTPDLQQTFTPVHDRQFIHRHQILSQLLKILSVGFLIAFCDTGVIQVDGLFPQ